MSLAVCVKEEFDPEETGLVCVKEEADLSDEAQWLKLELEVAPEAPDLSAGRGAREGGAGLYAGHVVKDELVLGPESLQRTGASLLVHGARVDTNTTPLAEPPPTTDAEAPRNPLEINTYMCDICGNLFTKKYYLIRHIKLHLLRMRNTDKRMHVREKEFYCNFCSKKFKQSGHRNRHVQTTHTRPARHHTDPRGVLCEVCHKSFKRPDSLRQHLLIHSGQKPYACDVCDKKFTQIGNLTRHARIHTGDKPYACEVCSRRFTQSCDLKKHMRLHTGDRPYRCELCAKTFTCSGDLRSHTRTKGHRVALRRQKHTFVQEGSPSSADDCIIII